MKIEHDDKSYCRKLDLFQKQGAPKIKMRLIKIQMREKEP